MTRTATISCLLLLAAIFAFVSYSRRHHSAATGLPLLEADATDKAEVMPVVNPGWSNLAARAQGTITSAALPNDSAVATQEVASAPEAVAAVADPNITTMGARAKELLAQVALASVGIDPEADQYWLAAVNDPNISPIERRALILELDQAGFPDARHPTADDLPLVASRIALLEQLGATAIDSANSTAFEEAYTELLGMFATITAPDLTAAQPSGTGE